MTRYILSLFLVSLSLFATHAQNADSLKNKLASIELHQVEFHDTPSIEVFSKLMEMGRFRDPSIAKVNLTIDLPLIRFKDFGLENRLNAAVVISANKISLLDALERTAGFSGLRLSYDDHTIVLHVLADQ